MGNKVDDFINDLADLSVAWNKLPDTGMGRRDHQRFGQYVINSDEMKGRIPSPWPEVFYAERYSAAYALLYGHALALND